MRIWVTRTEPGAARTAERLRALGHEPLVAPVLAFEPLGDVILDLSGATSLAFTSPNAVSAFAALSGRRNLRVFAVGEGTAAAARAAGFEDVESADGDIDDLTEHVARARPEGVVVWPSAAEPAGDLAALLGGRGVHARRIPVYRSVETGAALPEGAEAVLVHSPRGGRAAAAAVSPDQARALVLFAISTAAAAPLAELPFARVAVAPRPNETALLALIGG